MSVENGLFDPAGYDGPTVDAIGLSNGDLVLHKEDNPDAWLQSDYWTDTRGDA